MDQSKLVGEVREKENKSNQASKPTSGKYANLIYTDFCNASSKQLNLVPIDMGYGDPASDKFIPLQLLKHLINELQSKNAGAYPEVLGEKKLIDKFKEYLKIDEGLSYDYDVGVLSSGGRSAITNILRGFLKPKDLILIPYPAWSGYKSIAKFLDATIFPIITTIKNRFVPSTEDVQFAINKAKEDYPNNEIKIIILNTPHNPTGTVYSSNDIKDILKVLHENNITCLADYTYRAIRDNKTVMPSVHKVAEDIEFQEQLPKGTFTNNIIAMQTLGKVSLTPGLRIGYVATTNSNIISDFSVRKQAADFSGNLFVQKAFADYLLTENQINEFNQTVGLFEKRRNAFIEGLDPYGYSPENRNIIISKSGFYLSFEIPKIYQKSLPLSEFPNLIKDYPFIEQSISADEYKGFFEARGYIPASEIFVLELIKNTAINILPGHLFCPVSSENPNDYENWVRVALIQDEESIKEVFKRVEKQKNLFTY